MTDVRITEAYLDVLVTTSPPRAITEAYLEVAVYTYGPPITGPTFAYDQILFGVKYAKGAAAPALSASVQRSLLRRGRLLPPTALTFRKAAVINGTPYAAGATWSGSVSDKVMRQLLRGKILH